MEIFYTFFVREKQAEINVSKFVKMFSKTNVIFN